MRRANKVLIAGITVIVVGVLLSSVLTLVYAEPTDATWERIQRDELLVVGIDPSFPPFGNFGPERPEGIDADLALAIAAEFGVEVRFVVLGYDGLYDSLVLGHVDVLISALRPDPLRTDRVAYSATYFDAGQVLVSQTPLEASFAALAGKVLAVEFASEGDVAAREELNPDNLLQLISPDETLQAVLDGGADVALVDRVSARLFAQEHPTLMVGERPLVSDPYVMAVKRENWRLYMELQMALNTLSASGELDQIIDKWLG